MVNTLTCICVKYAYFIIKTISKQNLSDLIYSIDLNKKLNYSC